MAVKVYKTGNYLVVDDGTELRYPAKDVAVVRRIHGAKTHYNFINFHGISPSRPFDLDDIVKEDGIAYLAGAFETFVTGSTGA